MPAFRPQQRCAWLLVLLLANSALPQQQPAHSLPFATGKETLTYAVEWRLIRAGTAKLQWTPSPTFWQGDVKLESVGLVNKLYRVDDTYVARGNDGLCATSSLLHAIEGKRNRETTVSFDRIKKHASYFEKDLTKNALVLTKDISVPACVHDLYSGLQKLRTLEIQPGQSAQIPISDGKKMAMVKVEAQEHEQVTTPTGNHKTTRYEVFIFNDVIYNRKARCFIWLTDDAKRTPVQIRVRMQSFLIGNINLTLEKEEHP